MIDDRPPLPRTGWIALPLAALLLQACALEPRLGGTGARVYAADLAGGAKACEVAKAVPIAGQTVETAMKLGNDGGWCGLSVRQTDNKAFDAGLLSTRPAHGSVLIHRVGDDTRIDYTPDRGFSGSDSFMVTLIPGSAAIRVAVSVAPAAAAPKV